MRSCPTLTGRCVVSGCVVASHGGVATGADRRFLGEKMHVFARFDAESLRTGIIRSPNG